MAAPSKDFIFNTLTSCQHSLLEEQTLFDTQLDNTQYWLYSDLYNLFGAPMFDMENMNDHIYQKFDKTPANKLKIAPYDFLRQHAVPYAHKYHIQSPHPPYNLIHKKGHDFKLSRYACYCMFHDKPNLIFTRTYFMMPDQSFETIYKTSYQFARIYQRAQLRESERILSGVLKKLNANIPLFQYECARTFFGGYTMDEVREMHGLNKQHPLADNMGAISMHARRRAIDNAIHKFEFAHTRDLRSFSMILHNEMRATRTKMISEYKFPPEKDIQRTSIESVFSDYKKLESNFINQYAKQHLKIR